VCFCSQSLGNRTHQCRIASGYAMTCIELGFSPPARQSVRAQSRNHTKRVLVVDEAADILRITARILSGMGLQVTTAEDGRAALDIALLAQNVGYGFDLIFLNVQLPSLNGIDAARQLRASGFDAPIVAICDNHVDGIRRQCFDAGCTDFIGPASDFDPICKIVQNYL
jgi:CheY-like chemotaxis protein